MPLGSAVLAEPRLEHLSLRTWVGISRPLLMAVVLWKAWKMTLQRLNRILFGGLLLLILSAVAEAAELEVKDARLRLLPGDLPAGGYFSLRNVGSQSVVLVGAESAAYEQVMMHRSTEKDGMASMEQVLQLELAPGETVNFAPGGYHLMLMKRLGPLAIGEKVDLTLLFADGFRLPVTFQVVSPAAQ